MTDSDVPVVAGLIRFENSGSAPRGAVPPEVEEVVRALGPADVVLAEGWKLARHGMIDVRPPVVDRDAVARLADLVLASAAAWRGARR